MLAIMQFRIFCFPVSFLKIKDKHTQKNNLAYFVWVCKLVAYIGGGT